jgi:hypothetical protein
VVGVESFHGWPRFRLRMCRGEQRSVGARGGTSGCITSFGRALDAPRAGDVNSRRDRPRMQLWWPVVSICAQPQLPGLSAAILPIDWAAPESASFLFNVNLRRVRRAVYRTCGWSRGSPTEAAVECHGVDPRAAAAAALVAAAAWRCADAIGGLPRGCSTAFRGAFDAPRALDADRAADRPQRRPW